jgi:hypothetical protein
MLAMKAGLPMDCVRRRPGDRDILDLTSPGHPLDRAASMRCAAVGLDS